MMQIKWLANALTVGRMIFSAALLLTAPLSAPFYVIYAACGVSDVLDGYTARKTHTASKAGAALDSMADLMFTGAMLSSLLPVIRVPLWAWLWLGGILLVKLGSLVTGLIKYRSLAFLHTYMNKLAGILMFFFPVCIHMFGVASTALLLCGTATVAAAEELAINLTAKTFAPDIRCILIK